MEQNSSPFLKSSITAGVYLGLISILISVIIWAASIIESMGLFAGAIVTFVSFVILLVFLFIFTKDFRNKQLGGVISFKEAFKFAMLAIIVATVISVIYTYIFQTLIAPDYMENLMAVMQQKTLTFMEGKGVPDAQIDKAMEQFEEIPTIWKSLQQTFTGGIIRGAIISVIIAAIVKRNEEDSIQ